MSRYRDVDHSVVCVLLGHLLVPLSLVNADSGHQQSSNNCVLSYPLKITLGFVFVFVFAVANKSNFLITENVEKATIQK